MWEVHRKAYESAEEVLSFQKGKSKPWNSQHTWKVIDKKKEIKTKLNITKSERTQNKIRPEQYRQKYKDPDNCRERES